MVIDDDASVITLLESALGKRGYSVVSASDAFTAAQTCAREKPDLVLLDFVLPAADVGDFYTFSSYETTGTWYNQTAGLNEAETVTSNYAAGQRGR